MDTPVSATPGGGRDAAEPLVELPPRYLPLRRLAAGGMGSIWLARDELLARAVAVKVLSDNFAEQPQLVERFAREARTAAALSGHPNVLTIYDVGEQGGRPFIVMEHLPGGTVADRLGAGGRLAPGQWLGWLRQAASALDFAHEHGVVHRDVKPGNLLFDGRGRLLIADFGIARAAYEKTLTRSGELLGSAGYISPEQARGEPGTAASDLYGLAVVAYELLTGARPFDGGGFVEQARRHLEEDPRPPSELVRRLPAAVDAVVIRGLAKQPARRWPSAHAFVDALARALAGAAGGGPARRDPVPVAPSRDDREPDLVRGDPPTAVATRRERAAAGVPRRALTVASVALAAVVVGVIAASAITAGDGSPELSERPSADRPRAQDGQDGASRPRPGAPGQASGEPAGARGGARDPAELNDAGFRLMGAGRYEQAIPLLERALSAFPAGSTELTHAYALYNLGRSLRLAGRPAEAVPLLERRLRIPNQRETVARELAAARRAAGG